MGERNRWIALGLLGAMTSGVEAKPLTGSWSTPGTIVTLDAQGGTLHQACGNGTFGPVRTDADGRFKVAGTFEAGTPGPQQADVPAAAAKSVYKGHIQGDRMLLTVSTAGGAPQELTLEKGRRVKLIRCY